MTIPQQLADQSHTLFSRIADAGRWADHPVGIETQDHAVIRSWAECHGLMPAASSTCREDARPPGTGQFCLTTHVETAERSVTWADWLTRFDALGLSFVFEATMSPRRLTRPHPARGMNADAVSDGSSSKLDVDAATTGRFRLKRARVGF